MPPTASAYISLTGKNLLCRRNVGGFSFTVMDDFISRVTTHSALCGHSLKLTTRDTSQGAGVKEVWKCPICLVELELHNSDMVKTDVVEEGRKFSRPQYEVNLRVATTFTSGVGMTKALEALNKNLGVKTARFRNLLHTNRKK